MIDTEHFRRKIEEELALLETELKGLGRKNPDNPADWEAVPPATDGDTAEENTLADSIEEFENNTAILKQLEIRYNDLRAALKRIEDGTYGTCEISGTAIEPERLEANPAARTNIANREREDELRQSS